MQQVIRDSFRATVAGGCVALLALTLFAAGPAGATGGGTTEPDSAACATIVEPEFGAYTVEKCVEIWAADNPGNPDPVSGSFTYVYTLESDPGSVTNIIRFDLEAPAAPNAISDAGFVSGTGDVDPTGGPAGDAVTVVPGDGALSGFVRYRFQDVQGAGEPCEGLQGLCPGAVSSDLVVHSPYGPGSITDNLVTVLDDFSLDAESTCIGPSTLPNPTPCSPLFWKLRALFSFFVKHHFADSRFDEVTQFAADASTVYDSSGELLGGLFTGFFSTPTESAERQLSALLLNIAAGELFPGNTKCRLFFDTPVDTDGDDVGDTTVGELLVVIESNILSGDPALILEARNTALKLNLGVGVLDTTIF